MVQQMIDIRRLDYSDIVTSEKELIELLEICLANNIPNSSYELACEYFIRLKEYIQDGSAVVVGAYDSGALIGFQWVYEIGYNGEIRFHSTFDSIYPHYQGIGIGSRLMNAIVEIAKERNISAIEAMCTVSNEAAVKYHQHNGFVIERYKMVKHF